MIRSNWGNWCASNVGYSVDEDTRTECTNAVRLCLESAPPEYAQLKILVLHFDDVVMLISLLS